MMVSVHEDYLWTAIEALDTECNSLAQTMDGDDNQQAMYEEYSAARKEIMRQITAAGCAQGYQE